MNEESAKQLALAVKSEGDEALAFVESFELATQEDVDDINDIRAAVKERGKELKEAKATIRRPMQAAIKALDDMFREPIKAVDAVELACKKRLGAFEKKQQQERVAAAAAAMAAYEAEESHEKVQALVEKASARTVRATGVQYRKTWRGEVADARAVCAAIASGELPIELVKFSQQELNKLARELKKEGTHHGVEIVAETVAAG